MNPCREKPNVIKDSLTTCLNYYNSSLNETHAEVGYSYSTVPSLPVYFFLLFPLDCSQTNTHTHKDTQTKTQPNTAASGP